MGVKLKHLILENLTLVLSVLIIRFNYKKVCLKQGVVLREFTRT